MTVQLPARLLLPRSFLQTLRHALDDHLRAPLNNSQHTVTSPHTHNTSHYNTDSAESSIINHGWGHQTTNHSLRMSGLAGTHCPHCSLLAPPPGPCRAKAVQSAMTRQHLEFRRPKPKLHHIVLSGTESMSLDQNWVQLRRPNDRPQCPEWPWRAATTCWCVQEPPSLE